MNVNDHKNVEELLEAEIAKRDERISEMETLYNNLNNEYANLNNRHTELQNRYDDCATLIEGVAKNDLSDKNWFEYLMQELLISREESLDWRAKAEGFQTQNDELLTLIDDMRTKGLKTHKDYEIGG